MWGRIRRRSPATVLAALLAAAIVAGAGYAAGGGLNPARTAQVGRVYACVTQRFATLNLSSATGVCAGGERKISWNAGGTRGPRGALGLRGQSGHPGASGQAGPTGKTGPQGVQGNAGPTGSQGVQGASGALASAYFDAYSSVVQNVAPGSAFTFDTPTETPVGVTANTAGSVYTVAAAGAYQVTTTFLEPDLHAQLEVNGAGVGPVVDVLCPERFTGRGAGCDTFNRILALHARDAVSLVNVGTTSNGYGSGSGITIVRVG